MISIEKNSIFRFFKFSIKIVYLNLGGLTHSIIYHEKHINMPKNGTTCYEMRHDDGGPKMKQNFNDPMKDYYEEPLEHR